MLSVLETLFSSAARVQILELFLRNPDRQFYQGGSERETGQPIRAVQREVERLEGIGLLGRSTEGNRVFYRLDAAFPLLPHLQALFGQAAATEGAGAGPGKETRARPEPAVVQQPFPWMEALPVPGMPLTLRRLQIDGEWDRAY